MKNIVIKWAVFLTAFLISLEVSAQNVRVSGVVTDALGPIPGANIMEEGTTNGTVTDVNGKYSISVSAKSTLVFSCIGYKEQKIRVGTKTVLNVDMVEESKMLDELVVVGYGVQRKSDVATSVASVKADEMKTFPAGNVADMLRGRAAGVNVTSSSGRPGSTPSITIRGSRSISADNAPLYIIDGSPSSATEFSTLSADDIESVEILKDAASQAIYGARAMAGVIVVTTKKGQAGKSHISYTGEFTMRMTPRYADFNIMNSQEQMGVYKEMKEKGWLNFSDTYRAAQSGVYGKMYQLMNTYNPVTGTFALEHTDTAMNDYLQEAEYRNTDWFDALFSNSVMHNHSVSLSSGTEKASFYASLSAMADPGWYKDSEVNRYTANLNATYNISKQLSINLISSAAYRKQKAPGTLSQSVDPVY